MKPLLGYESVKAPKPPKPRVGVKKINAHRAGHRFPKSVNEPLRAFTRTFPCVIADRLSRVTGVVHRCRTDVVCCHHKTQGSGGPDENNTFPGCWDAHRMQEGRSKEFEWEFDVRLKPVCRRITTAFWREYPQLRSRLA